MVARRERIFVGGEGFAVRDVYLYLDQMYVTVDQGCE